MRVSIAIRPASTETRFILLAFDSPKQSVDKKCHRASDEVMKNRPLSKSAVSMSIPPTVAVSALSLHSEFGKFNLICRKDHKAAAGHFLLQTVTLCPPPLPTALVHRRTVSLLRRARPQRPGARD